MHNRVLRKPPCPVTQSRAICIISRVILAGRTASASHSYEHPRAFLWNLNHRPSFPMTNKSAVRIIAMRVREFVQWARYRHPQRVHFA